MKRISKRTQNDIVDSLQADIYLFCKDTTKYYLKNYLISLKADMSYWLEEYCTQENNQ